MYDLHAHLLPGLDDGPKAMDEAVEMARVAAQHGTKAILATPHMKDVNERSSVQHARDVLAELAKNTKATGIELSFFMGMENHLVPDLSAMFASGRALPINGSRYALVELPFFERPNYLEATLFQLQLQGITPVLAHPERIECVQKDAELLVAFVQRGMLSQITAGSLVGHFGADVRRFTEELLQRGLAHVMASDCHHASGPRSPKLTAGVAAATKLVGAEMAQAMVVDTPKAILENQTVKIGTPQSAGKKRKWWSLGR
ncbi:MAG: tyrosine protein phosphatase [SAR202 cluster bacterium]|nr:tyrosine protein phosphatase [SAR202 cluster bacterium]